MMRSDPIIAVKDVQASAQWYQELFGLQRKHGGNDFAVMVAEDGEIVLCLHKWGEHEHPSMMNPDITPGNGLILYLRTENLEQVWQKAKELNCDVEEEIHHNPNSLKKEFSLRDPDGYYLTITEYHEYAG